MRRLRESSDRTNTVSLHLAAKHQLSVVYDSAFCLVTLEQYDSVLALVERMIVPARCATVRCAAQRRDDGRQRLAESRQRV